MSEISDNDWYVLDVPHRGNPRVYRYFGKAHFISDYYDAAEMQHIDCCIFQKTTARKIAAQFGALPETITDAIKGEPWLEEIATVAQAHGWDAALYRADYARREGEYSPVPIDEMDAVSAWAAHDLSAWYLCKSTAEVLELVAMLEGERAPRVGQCGPVRAAMALRRAAGLDTPVQDEDDQ